MDTYFMHANRYVVTKRKVTVVTVYPGAKVIICIRDSDARMYEERRVMSIKNRHTLYVIFVQFFIYCYRDEPKPGILIYSWRSVQNTLPLI